MKKILALCLTFIIVFCLSACGNDKKDKNNNTVDIEYYVNLGEMPECDFSLGDSIENVKAELEEKSHNSDDEHFIYNIIEGKENVLIDNGIFNYYYKKNAANNGISYIVNYDSAYGFELGTINIEIKNAMKDFEYEEEPLSDDNAFFMFGLDSGSVIRCKFKENSVLFVFSNNALCATSIYSNENWS